MATDLDAYRRYYAEGIQICSNLRTPALVEALATIPRERFLPPGPWTIRGEADFQSPLRQTPGKDPRFIYHNVAVGIDTSRMLFNGAPSIYKPYVSSEDNGWIGLQLTQVGELVGRSVHGSG